MSHELYKDYVGFKSWDEAKELAHQDFFDVFKLSGITAKKLKILEIGCGAGRFMDWARQQGHDVEGTELLPDMVEAVRKRSFKVHQAPVTPYLFAPQSFDVVIAIDVLEHLDLADLKEAISLARKVLKPAGRLIAQFPNGASPFSGRYQSGDWTHNKPLSPSALRQIAEPMGMQLLSAVNPRSIPPGLAKGIRRRLVYAFRNIIELALGLIYFGERFPMDPNVLVVLSPMVRVQ
jgi:2-polyprenyl-3-methyl-5-hydroxy-6-metoxy-1,4-benzoquinol methylase